MKAIGVDIGGTSIKVGLIEKGRVKKLIVSKTPKTKKEFLSELKKSIDSVFDKKVKGIGIGIPGQAKDGIISDMPNLAHINNINLKKILEKRYRKKVVVDNDANCFAYEEALYGQGKNKTVVVGLTLGTGFGSGIVVSKNILHGKDNLAGEVGHVKATATKELEDFCSAKFIKTSARLLRLKGNPKEIYEMAKKGNSDAIAIFEEFGINVGHALALMICILNPDIIIIAGSVANSYKLFEKPMKKRMKEELMFKGPKGTKIAKSRLKYPGLVGAAALVG